MPKFSLKRISRRRSTGDLDHSLDNSDMDDQTVRYEGYLERKTGVMKNFKKLWFQLYGRELKFYKTNPEWDPSSPKGTMNVADIQTVKAMSTQSRHLIQIITPKGTVCLSGESAAYCEEWVTHLRKAMQGAKQSKTLATAPDPPLQKGRSSRRPAMSTVSEEEDRRSSNANAGQEYELLATTPTTTPTSNDEFLYEEVQPVKRQPPPTVGNGQTLTSDSDMMAAGLNEDAEQRDSTSSGYSSTEGIPTEHDTEADMSNVGKDFDVPALPYPPLTQDNAVSINQLRRMLAEMGVNAIEEDDMYMNTTSGIQELKLFLKTTFFVTF